MNFTIFIFIFFCAILIKIIYEAYSIHKLITFDENCYSLKKIIVDKININSYHDNNFYINSQTNIGKFI